MALALDTNVASELMRPEPMPTVWISERDGEDLYLTAVSEAELLYGVAILPTADHHKDDHRFGWYV